MQAVTCDIHVPYVYRWIETADSVTFGRRWYNSAATWLPSSTPGCAKIGSTLFEEIYMSSGKNQGVSKEQFVR